MSYPFPPPNSGYWTTELCDCFEDCSSCCLGAWCPCIAVGRTAEILDHGAIGCGSSCCVFSVLQAFTGCGFLYTCGYRKRLRAQFGLPESPCGDCLTDFCCLSCSVCQVYRELKNRQVDPALGYDGVRHLWERPLPPGHQFMHR
ncbi:hypothetical protein R1flu_018879 [Riccia fluitans]|uniref:Uncharacterized protein n=1 Tax=Riccia fluitans TaxID=41844 RepID=A0ABD1ZJC1_9MARC